MGALQEAWYHSEPVGVAAHCTEGGMKGVFCSGCSNVFQP